MKFTKEEASKEITAKLTPKVENISKWGRTITENIETLWSILGEDSEMELSDFVEKALPLFNTTAGFLRKENADLAKGYEARIQAMQIPNPTVTTTPPPAQENELLKRLEALERENEEHKKAAFASECRSKVVAKIKEKGIRGDKWMQTVLANESFDESTDIDAVAGKYVELYNSMMATPHPNITPNVAGGTGNDYTNDTIKAAAALIKQQNLYGKPND